MLAFLLLLVCSLILCKDVPFTDCLSKPSSYTVEKIDVMPVVIKAGVTMIATVNGTVTVTATSGDLSVDVSTQGTHLLHYDYNLCTVIDCGCPTKLGEHALVFKHDIPPFIIPGKYTFVVKVTDQTKAEISCTTFSLEISQ